MSCAHVSRVCAGSARFSKIKLLFTANHGKSAVCVGRLKLLSNGKQVPYPSGTKSAHKGVWSSKYHSDNLVKASGYYCSDKGSFKNSRGNEEVLVTMSSAVAFDSFSLQQHADMGYNPKAFTVTGLGTDGKWVELHKETSFNFAKAKAVATFKSGRHARARARSRERTQGPGPRAGRRAACVVACSMTSLMTITSLMTSLPLS